MATARPPPGMDQGGLSPRSRWIAFLELAAATPAEDSQVTSREETPRSAVISPAASSQNVIRRPAIPGGINRGSSTNEDYSDTSSVSAELVLELDDELARLENSQIRASRKTVARPSTNPGRQTICRAAPEIRSRDAEEPWNKAIGILTGRVDVLGNELAEVRQEFQMSHGEIRRLVNQLAASHCYMENFGRHKRDSAPATQGPDAASKQADARGLSRLPVVPPLPFSKRASSKRASNYNQAPAEGASHQRIGQQTDLRPRSDTFVDLWETGEDWATLAKEAVNQGQSEPLVSSAQSSASNASNTPRSSVPEQLSHLDIQFQRLEREVLEAVSTDLKSLRTDLSVVKTRVEQLRCDLGLCYKDIRNVKRELHEGKAQPATSSGCSTHRYSNLSQPHWMSQESSAQASCEEDHIPGLQELLGGDSVVSKMRVPEFAQVWEAAVRTKRLSGAERPSAGINSPPRSKEGFRERSVSTSTLGGTPSKAKPKSRDRSPLEKFQSCVEKLLVSLSVGPVHIPSPSPSDSESFLHRHDGRNGSVGGSRRNSGAR